MTRYTRRLLDAYPVAWARIKTVFFVISFINPPAIYYSYQYYVAKTALERCSK